MAKRSLLVTGASGQLGGEVARRLVALGGDDVIIAGSREVGKLAGLDGVVTRRVDFDDDEATLQAAFEGVDRALIVSTDALDRPGRRAEQHLRAIRAAKAAGVKHLVYTSLAKAADDSAIPIAKDHVLTERALEASTSAGIALIVNYMTGFVNEDSVEARAGVERVAHALRQSGNRGRLEVNEFQLERLAPEAGRSHLRITRTWPWASVCDWEPIERRRLHALVG